MATPPVLLLLLSFLLLLLLRPAHSRSTSKLTGTKPALVENDDPRQQHASGECDGRRIHIRDLPSQFNSDLLLACDSSSFPLLGSSSNFCASLSDHGLGPRTHNRSRSWYRTDSHRGLEPLFHRRMLEYPCLVPDPSLADAIFLPYYSALDSLPFLYSPDQFNSSFLHGLSLYYFLTDKDNSPHLWSRNRGFDHFLVLAGPAWDFSQAPSADPVLFGTSFLAIPELSNLTVLTLESRPSPWQEHAVPYPTSFHPATLARLDAWLSRARSSRRPNLALFVGGGGGGGPNVRGSIRAECENRTDLCEVVNCSGGSCAHDPIRFMRPMLRSDFCLQPPGDTPTRRSTFDGILAGCVPVFFEELGARAQYGWHLPRGEYDKFSVFIPKEDVVFNGVRILEVLEAIPRDEVRRMRERVLELAPGVMYRRQGSSDGLRARKDAFDLAIEGVLRRIRRRVRSIAEPELLLEEEDDDL